MYLFINQKKRVKRQKIQKLNNTKVEKKKDTKAVLPMNTKMKDSNSERTREQSQTYIDVKLLDHRIEDYDEAVDNSEDDSGSSSDYCSTPKPKPNTKFTRITMFGLTEQGETISIVVNHFKPFFYLKVDDSWTKNDVYTFMKHDFNRRFRCGYNPVYKYNLVKRKTLYGFDDGHLHTFIAITFENMENYNRVKNLFYKKRCVKTKTATTNEDQASGVGGNQKESEDPDPEEEKEQNKRILVPYFSTSMNTSIELYEANIPPLLRFFHIHTISPSGWLRIKLSTKLKNGNTRIMKPINEHEKMTTCLLEYHVSSHQIDGNIEKETNIPYKICSFDIEALSSHGDFPLAKKGYRRQTQQIVEYWDNELSNLPSATKKDQQEIAEYLKWMMYGMFRLDEVEDEHVDAVDTKSNDHTLRPTMLKKTIHRLVGITPSKTTNITLLSILLSKMKREDKLEKVNKLLESKTSALPQVQGDIVTFIGSTFRREGETEPYLNHCIALDTCEYPHTEATTKNTIIESYENEIDVLLAWTELIQKEDPDIIIGYNIFGFDYKFMMDRLNELGPEYAQTFLKLSRVKEHVCGREIEYGPDSGKHKLKETSISIASGKHELHYPDMPGRIQIDLYNYFRREYNLESYKLDFVSGYFIRNKIKTIDDTWITSDTEGLKVGSFIHIEEVGHSSDYYENGAKFKVIEIEEGGSRFRLDKAIQPDMSKKVLWTLAKDDVSPQDIFDMTRKGPMERGVIAKYCIQDCNLVHHLLRKIDVITGFVEMSNLCSVPMEFLILRGQGIKLFSFIAKQCRLENTLIKVLDNNFDDSGFEGAIVLPPKCGLYLDEPVACVDYSSLYPSSMISENLSHDSKVWSKEYDLEGNLLEDGVRGEKTSSGDFTYDNLDHMKYIDVTFDTYRYLRKTESTAKTPVYNKVKVGYKEVRFAKARDGKKAIMPSILERLLKARKDTRKQSKFKTIETSIGEYTGLVTNKTDEEVTLVTEKGDVKIIQTQSILSIRDTYDTFMKNVLDKRQLAIKVTANSLYGQCGAKTSSFYDQDVAASTTAIGRKLLKYGQKIVEDVYGDKVCDTKYGPVHSHAEYIYGDSVTGDTPIILRTFDYNSDGKKVYRVIQKRIDDLTDIWVPYEEFKPFDTYTSNRREKQQSNNIFLNGFRYEIWTKNGWKKLNRVIRHKCNKSIYRIVTNYGVVDATEDHSLIDSKGKYVKPTDIEVGDELFYNDWNNPRTEAENSKIETSVSGSKSVSIIYDNMKRVLNALPDYYGSPLTLSSLYGSTELKKSYYDMLCSTEDLNIMDCLCGKWNTYGRIYVMGIMNRISFINPETNKFEIIPCHSNVSEDKEWFMQLMSILLQVYDKDAFCYREYDDIHHRHDSESITPIEVSTITTPKETSSKIKIICTKSDIEDIIMKDISMNQNSHGEKIVPEFIMNNDEMILWYLRGMCFGGRNVSVDRDTQTIHIQDISSKTELSYMMHLMNRIGGDGQTNYSKREQSFSLRVESRLPRTTSRRNTLGSPRTSISKSCRIQSVFKILDTSVKPIQDDGPQKEDYVYDIETEDGTFNCGFPLIIKNTDSVFMSFKLTDLEGNKIVGKDALKYTIELGKQVGKLATKFLKGPHDLEYEKTFMPFCLLSKKRYVGMLYEEDPDVAYRKSMGIVLKRRDNAPIVKDIYGGIIDILMHDKNINKATHFMKRSLENMIQEKYPLDKLVITKSIRDYYKNPRQIAHKVLADRMGKRDPGNKPRPGDRIPFVYIQKPKQERGGGEQKKMLQGDKIETPEYIRSHKLKPDYGFYITNQIMKPVQQLFSLVLEDIPEFRESIYKGEFYRQRKILECNLKENDPEKYEKKLQALHDTYVKKILFDKSLMNVEQKSMQRAKCSFIQRFKKGQTNTN